MFPYADYGAQYPLSYVLDYTLVNATGIDHLAHLRLFPLFCLCLFTSLCYVFASRLFGPLAALLTGLLAMLGMHYVIFIMGAHSIGVILLLTTLVLLWQQDTSSRVLVFILIAAVIICHPVSPILLGIFLLAALVATFSSWANKSRAVVVAMLMICMVGWFIWPTTELVEGVEELRTSILPGGFETTERFLFGRAFIYESLHNINRAIYVLYALLALAAVAFIFRRNRLPRRGFKGFLSTFGGLTRAETFMTVSVPILVLFTVLLGEQQPNLMERGLTFTILAMSGLMSSIATRVHESAKPYTGKFIAGAVAVILLLVTLAFPVVSYSIDAYTSFPISEEAGLKFLAEYAPLDKKILSTTSAGQMTLYRPYIAPPINLHSPSSLEQADVFVFRITGYYYSAMRHDLSFEDNWFTRYLNVVNTSNEFNRIYFNPTTSIFMKVR